MALAKGVMLAKGVIRKMGAMKEMEQDSENACNVVQHTTAS